MTSIYDPVPTPPTGRVMGWQIRAVDTEAGTIEIGFTVDDRFVGPLGTVQGGFLAAMLEDTQGPAVISAGGGNVYPVTVDFHVVCLRPARAGDFIGKARIVRQGKSVVVTESELFDGEGELVARGTFVSRVMQADALERGDQ